jgi:hypothetical protein
MEKVIKKDIATSKTKENENTLTCRWITKIRRGT